ncbi:MAG: DNA-directed RNA polymerase subunit omega [Clostridia bacterium]|nr:DNA-directed RNA polymerase subunit omega [Clostridia bacterium]
MMLYPEISKLMEGMPSRYSLVIVTAKRARQIAEESNGVTDKPVSMAVKEIAEGHVKIREEDEI